MLIFVDIDNTICRTVDMQYDSATPMYENIEKINNLYNQGNTIIYYSARGSVTKIDWRNITEIQLNSWGCKYHELSVGEKPPYDLMICDKTKRIEEI
jgi:hypothetical protein